MCGIAAIIDKKNTFSTDYKEKSIQKMTDAVAHRGPDGEGFYFDKNIVLGHRRLSIIDLSEDGKQPFIWSEKYIISFNGEIYNYLELKVRLEKEGYIFKTLTDTEVILASYDFWGEACVLEFNGMWGFIIYDKEKEICFCSRDRFGVKPFYYLDTNDCFLVGSEVKQLLPFMQNIKGNERIIVNYLVLNMSDYDDETFFEGIKKLLGGHNLVYDLKNNRYEIQQYYTINIRENVTKLNEIDTIKAFTKQFDQSIQYRLRSDVKVGTCLSGGLDSSSIAAFANRQHQLTASEKFCAITASSIQKEYDELEYAQKVVDSLGLDSYVTKPTKDDFLSYMDKVIYAQEYPFAGPTVFMQYFVMQKAKEAGITVLLDGQGADEILLGYKRYIPTLIFQKGILNFLFNIQKTTKQYGISIIEIFENYLYFSNPYIRLLKQKANFRTLKKEYHSILRYDIYKKFADSYTDTIALQKLELTTTHVPQLLRFEDKNSMAHSIETRLPFLDWEVVETALSIHPNFKLKESWSKYILRKTVENYLPADIVWRKNKLGFDAPIDEWMDAGVKAAMMETINNSNLLNQLFSKIPTNMANPLLWRLYNLAKWETMFDVKIKKGQCS